MAVEAEVFQEESAKTYGYKVHEVEERCQTDFNFLAGMCLPDVCTIGFPQYYLYIASLLFQSILSPERNFDKYAIGLPRGFAKTTFMKIIIIYCLLFSKKRFILVVCASSDLAEGIVGDICGILSHPNIIKVFGNWQDNVSINRQDLKKFVFRGRTIILRGIGSGTTVRGINVDNARPDFILMEDMQTQDEAESPILSKKLQKWMVGTLMKTKSPTGCTYAYIGNMYRDINLDQGGRGELYTCILRNLTKNPEWTSIVVGGILEDGSSLWEELQPIDQLYSEMENDIKMGCAEVFFSEVLNDPNCSGGEWFDLSKMPEYPFEESTDLLLGKFLMIDPSLGRKQSDAQVVAEFDVYESPIEEVGPVPVVKKYHIMQVSAPDLVDNVIELALKNKIPLVCAESVAYQGSLVQWFEKIASDKNIGSSIKFYPITPGGRKKNQRIITACKSIMAGKLILHPNVLAQFLQQIQAFDPLSNNNDDDILDTTAYGEDVLLKYPTELLLDHIYDLSPDNWDIELDNCVF